MMKTIIKYFILCIGVVLVSCSSGGGDDTPDPEPTPKNVAPTVPSLVYPTNNLLCINNVLEFEWNASTDSNGDAITYKIDVSKDSQFSSIDYTATSSAIKHTFTLEKGIAYYWRVKATDSKNESSNYSSIYNLYTEGERTSNHLPFVAELIAPLQNAEENSGTITLEWTGSDVDNDPLTFDVYFDMVNPPVTKVSENQSESTLSVAAESGKDYYWKVVVKDDKGGEAIGQVWNFSTN